MNNGSLRENDILKGDLIICNVKKYPTHHKILPG
jgi:hypothetical protein